jgi:DNA-binding winged helix-turn-helix (wHTH) protein/tetratricopeptide (TPR) repeat protein
LGPKPPVPTTARFGLFEFRAETGELSRKGVPRRLENQPARLLAYLIEHRDRLVTRHELIQLLWPGQEHGDFDHRLDKATAKLRSVLSDASQQRFIKTVRGRGLRFVADVTMDGQSKSLVDEQPRSEATFGGDFAANENHGEEFVETSSTRAVAARIPALHRWTLAGGVAAGVLVAVVAGLTLRERARVHAEPRSAGTLSIAVIGIMPQQDAPPEDWISRSSVMWLANDLQSNCSLRVVPDFSSADLTKVTEATAEGGFSREALEQVRRRTGADLVIFGRYDLQSRDAAPVWQLDMLTQNTLHPELLQRASVMGPQTDAPSLIQAAQVQLCTTLGVGLPGDKSPGLSAAALPANGAAARLYAEGLLAFDRSDLLEAGALFNQVAELEPGHPYTHAQLARIWAEFGNRKRAREEYEAALADAKEMSPRQQSELWAVRCEISADWTTAVSVYQKLASQYPQEVDYRLRMASDQIAAGLPELAQQTLASIPPAMATGLREAQIELTRAAADASTGSFARQLADATHAEKSAGTAGQTLLTARALRQSANAQFALGHWSEARQAWQQAADIFAAQGDRRGTANVLYDQGRFLWAQRQPVESRHALEQSVALSQSLGDNSDLAASLAFLANVRLYSGADPKDADITAKPLMVRANHIYQENGDIGGQGVVQGLLGDLYMCQSQYDTARSAYMAALALSKKVNDRSRIANRLLDLGIVVSELGDNGAAIQYYNQSIAAYQELGQQDRVSLAKNRLANVLFREGEVDRAIALSQQALQTMQSIGFVDNGIMEDLSRFEDEREPAKGEALAKQSLQESNDKVDSRALCVRYMVLAEAQTAEGKLQDADASIRHAFAMNMVIDDWVEAAEMLWARAEISRRTGHLSEARADLERALRISRKYGSKRYEMPVRLSLAEVDLASRGPGARREMEQVERDSEKLGYYLLSQKAKAALQSAA